MLFTTIEVISASRNLIQAQINLAENNRCLRELNSSNGIFFFSIPRKEAKQEKSREGKDNVKANLILI